jgi:hypothetical protein
MVAMSPALALAASTPDFAAAAARMRAAKGPDAVREREALISAAPNDPSPRDAYAENLDKQFRSLLSDNNADARLNTAILYARLGTISTDKPLIEALSSKDPAVRYWGAKGLGGTIAANLKRVGANPAIQALRAAAKDETSGVVQQEILRALVVYESIDGVLDGLQRITDQMATDIPDRGALDAIAYGLGWVQTVVSTANPAQKARAATIASRAASFTAQQQEAYSKFAAIPSSYADAARTVVENSAKMLSAAAGRALRLGNVGTPTEMVLAVNALVGTGATKGELQSAMPAIPVPPKVGSGGGTTQPGTSTTTTQG